MPVKVETEESKKVVAKAVLEAIRKESPLTPVVCDYCAKPGYSTVFRYGTVNIHEGCIGSAVALLVRGEDSN